MTSRTEGYRTWYDHRGEVFAAPVGATTCYDSTGPWRTHRLFGPHAPTLHQAMTWCGRRAGPIPGSEVVDCPVCLSSDVI